MRWMIEATSHLIIIVMTKRLWTGDWGEEWAEVLLNRLIYNDRFHFLRIQSAPQLPFLLLSSCQLQQQYQFSPIAEINFENIELKQCIIKSQLASSAILGPEPVGKRFVTFFLSFFSFFFCLNIFRWRIMIINCFTRTHVLICTILYYPAFFRSLS